MPEADMTIKCRQCGKEFVFTQAEQEFFKKKGFTLPHRCKECRIAARSQAPQPAPPVPAAETRLVCAQCGLEIGKEAAAYCSGCLANVQLEFDMKTRKLQATVDASGASDAEADKAKLTQSLVEKDRLLTEADSKLNAALAEKAQVADQLRAREQAAIELQEQLKHAREELDNVRQSHAAPDGLAAALAGVTGRLKAVEATQAGISDALLQLVERVDSGRDQKGFLDRVKRSLGRSG